MRVQAATRTPAGCWASVMPSANLISFLVSSRPPMSAQVILDTWLRLETMDWSSFDGPGAPALAGASDVGGGGASADSPLRSRAAYERYSRAFFLRRSSASRPWACSAHMDIRLAAFS